MIPPDGSAASGNALTEGPRGWPSTGSLTNPIHQWLGAADQQGVNSRDREPSTAANVVVGVALAVGAGYLVWRAGWTRTGSSPWLFWPLWLAEATVLVGLLRTRFELWTLRVHRRHELPDGAPRPSVDVVVICRDEPIEVLRATLLGCAAIRGEHNTIALDTIGRAELSEVTSEAGALHLVAPSAQFPQTTAEAIAATDRHPVRPAETYLGEIADRLGGELVTVLHGDDVPLPNLLEELEGDFADPRVWLAQGRQASYAPSGGPERSSKLGLDQFFSMVMPGKNRHGAAYWCGSGALVRTSVLREALVRARPSETPTFEVSMRAHAAGWRSTYHDEAVVLTLSGPGIAEVLEHHRRWAGGNLRSLLDPRSALFRGGLDHGQWMSYLGTGITYLGGLRRLAIIAVLTVSLLLGALPLSADPTQLVALWGTWMGLHVLAERILTRRNHDDLARLRDNWMLMGAHCTGWVDAVVPGLSSRVRAVAERRRPNRAVERPVVVRGTRLLLAGTVAVILSALTRLVSETGAFHLPSLPTAALQLELVAAGALVAVTALVFGHIRRDWRRAEPRFAVRASAELGDRTVPMLDVSETGASVALGRPPRVGTGFMVGLLVPGLDGRTHRATVAARVVSVRPNPTAEMGHVVGLSFTRTSQVAADRLAEYCRVLLPARVAQVDWTPGGSIRPTRASAIQALTVSTDSGGRSPGGHHRVSRISGDDGTAASADAS